MELHYLFYVLVIGCAGSITAFIKNGGGGGIRNLLKRTWDGVGWIWVRVRRE